MQKLQQHGVVDLIKKKLQDTKLITLHQHLNKTTDIAKLTKYK